ncbi:hypothetical protein QWY76_00040 [Halomonas maura]|nr:hypothetical protein [Halomonas maura]MDN3554371.1 hypothetical protein [Halomonas maura]
MPEEDANGKTVTIDGHRLAISHRDKVLFPGTDQTKGDLIDYYDRVAATLVPHLADHPVSLQRFPDGLDGEGFYQKDAPAYFPD